MSAANNTIKQVAHLHVVINGMLF